MVTIAGKVHCRTWSAERAVDCMNAVYKMVTDKIIKYLEAGMVPWQRPWSLDGCMAAHNRVSGKAYSMLNQMMLQYEGEYASCRQWEALGGKLKPGAEREFVVFWKLYKSLDDTEEISPNGYRKKANTGCKNQMIPILRYHAVYHVSQVDGVKALTCEPDKRNRDLLPCESANRILKSYWERENLYIRVCRSSRAFYDSQKDLIVCPEITQFRNEAEYYSTLFHESVHSTGNENRLKRSGICKYTHFGDKEYAKEELIAEIGSAMLMSEAGLNNEEAFCNSAAYVNSWIQTLQNDPCLIVFASSRAEKAVRWILKGGNDEL